jgi:protein-disulfide isomerase
MPLSSLPGRAMSDLRRMVSRPLTAAAAAAFIAASAFAVVAFPREPAAPDTATLLGEAANEERAAFQRWYESQRRLPPPVPAEGARVLIVKFNDYQCPACAQTYRDYQRVLAGFEASQPGTVRLVALDFPLERECNAGVTSTLHEAACEAAVAVRLAREHGRAAALEEHLFTNQPAMTPAQVRTWAREIGQVTDFEARYAATLDAVRTDVARGLELGVRSTPTFLINGTVVEGGLPPHLLEQAIQYELSRAEK